MKKNITILAISLFSLTSFAQKGSWYIGGQVGYNSKNTESTNQSDLKSTEWSFAPEMGTFLTDHWQLGFAVNLYGSTEKQDTLIDVTKSKFAPVLYLRRFVKVTDEFWVFAGIVTSITTGTSESNKVKSDISGGAVNLSLGALYVFSPKFVAVAQYGLLGYTSEKTTSGSNEVRDSNVGLNINALGPVLNVGLYYTFTK